MASYQSEVQYLARSPLYETEKPFMVNLQVPEGERQTNHVFEAKTVLVHDGRNKGYSMDVNGFAFMKLHTKLEPHDFYDASKVETTYVEEIDEFVRQNWPEFSDVVFLDYNVRDCVSTRIYESRSRPLIHRCSLMHRCASATRRFRKRNCTSFLIRNPSGQLTSI